MFLHSTNTPFKNSRKGMTELGNTLVIIIVVLALIGVVSYIIYSKIISGNLTPLE